MNGIFNETVTYSFPVLRHKADEKLTGKTATIKEAGC